MISPARRKVATSDSHEVRGSGEARAGSCHLPSRRTFTSGYIPPPPPHSLLRGKRKAGFDHGDTPVFPAISAVALRHNEISQTPFERAEPVRRQCTGVKPMAMSTRVPGARGFYAAMRLRLPAWAPLLDASNVNHRLLRPIRIAACSDVPGRPIIASSILLPTEGSDGSRSHN